MIRSAFHLLINFYVIKILLTNYVYNVYNMCMCSTMYKCRFIVLYFFIIKIKLIKICLFLFLFFISGLFAFLVLIIIIGISIGTINNVSCYSFFFFLKIYIRSIKLPKFECSISVTIIRLSKKRNTFLSISNNSKISMFSFRSDAKRRDATNKFVNAIAIASLYYLL